RVTPGPFALRSPAVVSLRCQPKSKGPRSYPRPFFDIAIPRTLYPLVFCHRPEMGRRTLALYVSHQAVGVFAAGEDAHAAVFALQPHDGPCRYAGLVASLPILEPYVEEPGRYLV